MKIDNNWMDTTYRKLHLDYHQPPWMTGVASAFTEEEARRQARMFKEAGIEAVEIFAYDHYGQAFYPSQIAPRHPGLQSDYTGLMNSALKDEGLKVTLYLNALTSVHLVDTHPDWLITLPDGSHPRGAWLAHDASHICISSPYMDRYFVPLLQEAVTRHEPDGVWIDAGCWMIDVPCYCQYCHAQYLENTGRALPVMPQASPQEELQDEDWLAWRIWRRGQIGSYVRKITDAVRAVKPDTNIADNNLGKYYFGVPSTDQSQVQEWLSPQQMGVTYLSCDPVPMGGNHSMILSREGRYQSTLGLPFEFMNERFHAWGEWQYRSPTDWKAEAATMLAVGARCVFADQPNPDGTLEPSVYAALRDVYGFVREREPFVVAAAPVPDMAILASAASNVIGPVGGVDWGRANAIDQRSLARTDRVNGAHLALIELGYQHLIYDERTLSEQLAEQSCVIIPDQLILDETTIKALEHYVCEGGKLLVTGRTGLYDECGRGRSEDPLAALLGVERDGELPAPIHYLKPSTDWLEKGLVEPNLLQAWGVATKVRPHTASILAELIEPVKDVWANGVKSRENWRQYTVFGAAPAGDSIAGPAITLNEYGKGKAMYVSVDLFALYYQEGHRLLRSWIDNCLAILWQDSIPLIQVRKPLHVEMSVMRQPIGTTGADRIIVHFVNYFAQKRSGQMIHMEEVVPVSGMEFRLRMRDKQQVSSVTLEPSNQVLEYLIEDSILTIKVPELDIHYMICIDMMEGRCD